MSKANLATDDLQIPAVTLTYDPQKRAIALSEEELRQLTERLYRKVGLLPTSPASEVKAATASSPGPVPPDQSQRPAPPASAHEIAGSTPALALPQAPVRQPAPPMDEERIPTPQPAPDGPSVVGETNGDLADASAVISPYQRS